MKKPNNIVHWLVCGTLLIIAAACFTVSAQDAPIPPAHDEGGILPDDAEFIEGEVWPDEEEFVPSVEFLEFGECYLSGVKPVLVGDNVRWVLVLEMPAEAEEEWENGRPE